MNKCPDKCSGGNSLRQHEVSEGQLTKLSNSAQGKIKQSSGRAYRCNYCGCVYLQELSETQKLGDLDGGVTGQGWVSAKYP